MRKLRSRKLVAGIAHDYFFVVAFALHSSVSSALIVRVAPLALVKRVSKYLVTSIAAENCLREEAASCIVDSKA
jgi:hypothetical protein